MTFHFKTVKLNPNCDEEVIDDSKRSGKPMELIIGKQFKLILWEEWIKNMRLNEVSELVVDKHLSIDYPFVSKCYRKYCQNNGNDSTEEDMPSRRCCGIYSLITLIFKTLLTHE